MTAMPIVDGLVTILPVTASTLSVALVLLILVGKGGVRSGTAFVMGWFVGAWAVLVLAMLGVLTLLPQSAGGLPPLVQAAIGVAAVTLGVAVLARRRLWPEAGSRERARLATTADALSPRRSVALGVVLVAASPRQWVFLLPAAILFTQADTTGAVLVLPLVGAVVATVGVATPVAVAVALRRSRPEALDQARTWWVRHGDAVGAGAAIVLGALFLIAAATGR
jgi:threonine/homoserine/homoserine lactone efflux protein